MSTMTETREPQIQPTVAERLERQLRDAMLRARRHDLALHSRDVRAARVIQL